MLKGIKKSKPNESKQQEKPDFQNPVNKNSFKQIFQKSSQNEMDDQLYTKNQAKLKQQIIEQEEGWEQQDLNADKQRQTFNIENNLQDKSLEAKAYEILQLFKKGENEKVYQQLEKLQELSKDIKSQNFKKRQNQASSNQKQSQQKPQKGKFEYSLNFQEDQEQQNKRNKSSKRAKKNFAFMRSQRVQDYCVICPDNEELKLISASNYVYLAFAKRKTFQKYWHFILAPVEHQNTSIGLNDDVLTQLSNYKKCLLQMFDKKGHIVVFFEQYFQQSSHIYIQCLAVPYTKGQDFPFFFKQSLESVEGNWTTHKTLIKVEKQKGGLQKQIPKKIKYFYIDFSLGYGYAHVIENQKFWKKDFCYDVIATALGLELYQVKTASQWSEDQLQKKEEQFKKMWEPYDWTKFL